MPSGLRWLLLQGQPMRGHSRFAGMHDINHWIPACAGMTTGVVVTLLPTIKYVSNKPLDSSAAGSRPACGRQARLYHPALAGTPPKEGNWNPRIAPCRPRAVAGTPPKEGNWNHLGRLFQTCLRQAGAA